MLFGFECHQCYATVSQCNLRNAFFHGHHVECIFSWAWPVPHNSSIKVCFKKVHEKKKKSGNISEKYHIQPDLIGKFCCCLMFFVERILDDWIFTLSCAAPGTEWSDTLPGISPSNAASPWVDLSPGNWKSSSWESQGPEHVLPPSSPNNPFTLPETNS